MADVTAIVLNWRLPAATLRVVEDLRGSGHDALHVLILDNGSGDGSAEQFAAVVGDGVELCAFEHNLGYCAAMNRGIERATQRAADYVLFLNNDVRLPPDFLPPLVSVLDNDPGVACVGPTVLDDAGRAWCQGGGVRFRPNLVTLFGQGEPPAPRDHGPEAVDFMPGACVLFRREDLERVGGLDEDYFMYWEDVDLGYRLRAHDRRIVWLPWVSVTHTPSQSSGGGRSPMRKYMSAVNTVRFLRRHGTVRLWLAFLVCDIMLWPFTPLSGTSVGAALAKARGLWNGLLGRKVTVADVARYLPESTP